VFARHRQLLQIGVFFLDALLIFASWCAAYWLRFHVLHLPAPLGVPPIEQYLWFGSVLTPFGLLILRSFRLYRSARTARLSQELWTLVQGVAILAAVAALVSYSLRGEVARSVLFLFALLAAVALTTAHAAIRVALRVARRRGFNLRHVLLVGTGDLAERVGRKMIAEADYGLHVIGMVAADPSEVGNHVGPFDVVGCVADLPGLAARTGADFVYVAFARADHEAEQEALERLGDSTAAVRLVPDLSRMHTLNASVEDFDGTPVVLVTETPEQGWNSVLKRAFDLVASAVLLLLLLPLLVAIGIWVKLDSPGPALYAQERVGSNGRRFRMLKFRTMRTDAEAEGPQWSRADDPRRTRGGEILRRLSLDELPQLWNVVRGEMSLVGPRPCLPFEWAMYRPWQRRRLDVKPGCTGLWQVTARSRVGFEEMVILDLHYAHHGSIGADLGLIARTVPAMLRGRGGY
jgi:exopolysaccharide biosynthesis polyprenyl glycosylphosphotransferase